MGYYRCLSDEYAFTRKGDVIYFEYFDTSYMNPEDWEYIDESMTEGLLKNLYKDGELVGKIYVPSSKEEMLKVIEESFAPDTCSFGTGFIDSINKEPSKINYVVTSVTQQIFDDIEEALNGDSFDHECSLNEYCFEDYGIVVEDKEDEDIVTINYDVLEQLINKYNQWKAANSTN